MKQLPDFDIQENGTISGQFLLKNIRTFHQATEFIQHLSYGRNRDKDDLTTVFSDNKGTCSTKHAVLKQLANENGYEHIKLMLGIFKMNGANTSKVAAVLMKNKVQFIPEAHNYLKFEDVIFDYTKPNSFAANFARDLIFEIEIRPNEIHQRKIELHKKYLVEWLESNPGINYSLSEIWKIREACIEALSD
ncbi:MAG: hypothetical protein KL787_10890 [Taibaiella sp.]|nr:hypothetical protein [Taibaiella sp.]